MRAMKNITTRAAVGTLGNCYRQLLHALLYLGHPCPRLRCPTSGIHALVCAVALCLPLAGQHVRQPLPPAAPELRPGLGEHHCPISTANAEAQVYFDRGIRLLCGFSHGEAARYFRRAAELDPSAPMPHW